jgi:hypothetical protein
MAWKLSAEHFKGETGGREKKSQRIIVEELRARPGVGGEQQSNGGMGSVLRDRDFF